MIQVGYTSASHHINLASFPRIYCLVLSGSEKAALPSRHYTYPRLIR
jgi:hypothetical protein